MNAELGSTSRSSRARGLKQGSPARIGPKNTPREAGGFGPILTEYKHDAVGAIKALTELQDGEAIAALHHPDVGDIDLVWGKAGTGASDGYGLAKLVQWHPEVLDDLQGILSAMSVVSRSENRINLESADHKAGVRLTWDGEKKHWLMTVFERREKSAADTSTDTDSLTDTDDTARRTGALKQNTTPTAAESKPAEADPFANNKLFTSDKVAAARARMKSKFGQLNSGIAPEMLIDGMTIAGAYIESGVRNFTQYAARMASSACRKQWR